MDRTLRARERTASGGISLKGSLKQRSGSSLWHVEYSKGLPLPCEFEVEGSLFSSAHPAISRSSDR